MNIEKRFPFLFHCWLFLEMPHVTLLLGLATEKAKKATINSGLDTSPQQFQVELILIIAFQSVSVQKNLNISEQDRALYCQA